VQRRLTRGAVPVPAARQAGARLALVLVTGAPPGVIAGSVIRVTVRPGPRVFDQVVAVLLPVGASPVVSGRLVPALAGKMAEGAGQAGEWCRTEPWR
jgi:hypothetical protein